MRVEVDQSIKIEQTSRDTVLAAANDIKRCVLLKASTKRKLIQLLREENILPEIFYPKIFCAALFILLKPLLNKTQEFIIDEEYTGKERQMKVLLNEYARKSKVLPIARRVTFHRVGKKSPAHELANEARKKRSNVYKIDLEEMLSLIL